MKRQIMLYYPPPTGIIDIYEGENIISGKVVNIKVDKIDPANGVVEITRTFFDGTKRKEIYKPIAFTVYEQ